MVLAASPVAGMMAPALSRATILLADDDDELRGTLRGVLEEEGYSVVEACNGVEAIELLALAADGEGPSPDVVVLDVCMPGYSGLGVLSVMQRFPRPPRTIVVTGMTDPSIDAFARRLGAVRVVHKPIDLDDLLSTVLAAAKPRP